MIRIDRSDNPEPEFSVETVQCEKNEPDVDGCGAGGVGGGGGAGAGSSVRAARRPCRCSEVCNPLGFFVVTTAPLSLLCSFMARRWPSKTAVSQARPFSDRMAQIL